jgi:ABC-2 type transport system permease protein
MNGPLLRHTIRSQRLRLLAVSIGLFLWGLMLPIVYSQFGATFRDLLETGVIPEVFAEFGGGNVFTLPGSIALGFIHPIALVLVGVFAVGFGTSAIAGERQRGTLEVLLARPIPRRSIFVTLFVAVAVIIGLLLLALLAGMYAGSAAQNLLDDLPVGELPLVWLNGLLLWLAFASFSLAASASFDRAGPAMSLSVGYLMLNYFLEILGSLWTDVAWSQEYSLFHHFQVAEILAGDADPLDFVILAVAVAIPLAWGLVVFPRRDLAAPA